VNLLNHKTALVLLFIVVLNAAASVLVWHLDFFVHGDLYAYGLIFSPAWAEEYWYLSKMLWTALVGATVLAAGSIVPDYLQSRAPSRVYRWTSFFLPTVACVYQGLGVWFLSQKDLIARSRLYDYGLPPDFDWVAAYNPASTAVLALMVIVFSALIIPAVKALGIIEIEIVYEDEEPNDAEA
jgi:hypothetical protein